MQQKTTPEVVDCLFGASQNRFVTKMVHLRIGWLALARATGVSCFGMVRHGRCFLFVCPFSPDFCSVCSQHGSIPCGSLKSQEDYPLIVYSPQRTWYNIPPNPKPILAFFRSSHYTVNLRDASCRVCKTLGVAL